MTDLRACFRSRVDMVLAISLAAAFLLWGGTKPPTPPVVTDERIRLDRIELTSRAAVLSWRVLDDSLVSPEYLVQRRAVGSYRWTTVLRTVEPRCTLEDFLVNRDYDWRIVVEVTVPEVGE